MGCARMLGAQDKLQKDSGETMNIVNTTEQLEALHDNLSGSSFTDVNLTGTCFSNVNLSDVSFENASFAGARLHNVTCTGMKIDDADLSGVAITASQVDTMTINGIPVADLLAAYGKG